MSATEQPGVFQIHSTGILTHGVKPGRKHYVEGSTHLSHMLHKPPGSNTDNFEDGGVTEAKLDNNEVCMCVISVVCERHCLCIVIVSNHVQT